MPVFVTVLVCLGDVFFPISKPEEKPAKREDDEIWTAKNWMIDYNL